MPFFKFRVGRSESSPGLIRDLGMSPKFKNTEEPYAWLDMTTLPKSGSSPCNLFRAQGLGSRNTQSRGGLLGSLVNKLAPGRFATQDQGQRKIKLDLSESRLDSYGAPEDWASCLDNPKKNFTTDLVMTDLRDGIFTADLPLKGVPFEDLIIKVCNNKLLLILQIPLNFAKISFAKMVSSRRTSRPLPFGYVDLPIYVDTRTLEIKTLTGGRNIISIRAMTKGYLASQHNLDGSTRKKKNQRRKSTTLQKINNR